MALKSTDRRVDELELNKQNNLVSGTTIKTINSNSLLGSGDISVQNTLVSGTNIKTINGNTLLGSGDLVISPSSTITVGTTPVTSGTDGRVFFQSGGVVQQDAGLFWDNTNKRLGVGVTPLTTLNVKGSATSGFDAIRFQSQYSAVGFLGSDNTYSWFSSGAGYTGSSVSVDSTNLRFRGNTTIFQNGSGTETIRILSTGFTGIGTNSPQARLDIRAQGALSTDLILRTRNSADTRNFLVVNGAGDVYNNGAGGIQSNTFFGENSGRNTTSNQNTFIGFSSGRDNTSGDLNTFIGSSAGRSNTTAVVNTFIGASAGLSTRDGSSNTFIGRAAGSSNISGGANVYVGSSAGQSALGTGNCYIGSGAALNMTNGNSNIFLGNSAGALLLSGANLTLSYESIFIGQGVRANANLESNQIVIGHNAIGTGSNSVTLGNTSITRTNLRGQVVISGFASAPTGVEGAIYYDSTTKKHYGFDGTTWNALY